MNHSDGRPVIDEDRIWQFLIDLRARRTASCPPEAAVAAVFDADGSVALVSPDHAQACLRVDRDGGWESDLSLTPAAIMFLDLYLPLALASAERPMTLAHLGQSLDGRIATESGASYYVTGPDNIDHLHRLRALCDAVLVGAGTAAVDNPRLTTRRVRGPNPVRVVIDPDCRVSRDNGLFQDGAAETVVVCRETCPAVDGVDKASFVLLDEEADGLGAARIVAALRERGLHALFVEGGGVTVSRFLREGALDRLHVTVAPLIVGSGRPGLSLPVIDDLSDALRPQCKTYLMGADVLFDCRLKP